MPRRTAQPSRFAKPREALRRAARRWVASHQFPGRRTLLVDHHLLPAAPLRLLSDMLIPVDGELAHEVVEVGDGVRLEVDLRSLAQRAIAYGLSDERELETVGDILVSGDVVLDVGANIGLYTVACACAVGRTGAVHAFEPNPAVADQLARNIALNSLVNVYVHRRAVSDVPGRVVVRSPDAHEPGLATIVGPGRPVAEVETVTLDNFAEEHGISRIALLKLDVEGAETMALRGARELISARRIERVLFEVLGGTTAAQEALHSAGYRLEVILPPHTSDRSRPCAPSERFAYANILATI